VAGFFSRLKGGLSKTRDNMVKGLDNVFSGYSEIDGDFYDDLEETLIMGDIGVNATSRILDKLRSQVEEKNIRSTRECRDLLIQNIREQMHTDEHAYDFENQKSVLFIIGVNGVGKTTSVGKLASIYKNKGKKVLVAAADTYRAAATEQLEEWTNRAGVPLVKGVEGADPASVIFDAVNSAKSKDIDILIVDTAGRLHNKKNLMDELRKIDRIIDREYPDAYRETLIVLDGTTGQNALSQLKEFKDVTEISGIILTKMDGTAKGGIAVAIQSEYGVPVKYIGVGEHIEDLQKFNSEDFVNAIFENEDNEEEGADNGEA